MRVALINSDTKKVATKKQQFKKITATKDANSDKPKLSPSTIANNKRYTVQITSKRILKDAQIFTKSMIEKGYDAYIQKSIIKNDNIWYRVRIGSYDNYNLASLAARDISSALNMPTWIDFIRREE